MATEILPSNDGLEEQVTKSWTPDKGETITTRKSGPKESTSALYTTDKTAATTDPTSLITSLNLVEEKGRGIYTIISVPSESGFSAFGTGDDGLQEILAIDVVRPIETAKYFADLEYNEMAAVMVAYLDKDTEVDVGWNATQKVLFKHLAMGRQSYYETAYVFRRTWRTNSRAQLRASMDGINTVQELPNLSKTLENLIAGLPDGQWLKRPTQVRFLGREGWDVSEEYLWAPHDSENSEKTGWSVVYEGGTFNGGS